MKRSSRASTSRPASVMTEPVDDKTPRPAAPRTRRRWLTVIKVLLGTVAALLALMLITVGVAVWILTPERLTPIVCKYGSEFLDADINAKRVELTFWSTFPRLTVEVEDLEVISRVFDKADPLQRSRIPAGADSLLSVGMFRGGINLALLPAGHINLYDVEIQRPRVNLVQLDSTMANYDIVPPSEKSEDTDTPLPSISLDRFLVSGGFPVRYRSIPDSLDVMAQMSTIDIGSDGNAVYSLKIDGKGGAGVADLRIPPMKFGVNGGIEWRPSEPSAVRLHELKIGVADVAVTLDAFVHFSDSLTVHEMTLESKDIQIRKVIDMIPGEYRGNLDKLRTNLQASLRVELLERYSPGSGRIPSLRMDLTMPKGTLEYGPLKLSRVEADVTAVIDGTTPDATVITVRRLGATGRAVDFTLSGSLRQPLSDPLVEATFDGQLEMAMLPADLLSRLPVTLRGRLSGHADAYLRQSWLTGKAFHKIRLDGELKLDDFHMAARDSSLNIYTRHAGFKLGSSSSVQVNGMKVDSLLTASLTVDTVALGIPGMQLIGKGLSMGLGSRNVSGSIDTTKINPMGASIRAERLTMRSDSDSVRVVLRDAFVKATLQRYNQESRSPLLKLESSLGAMRMADRYNRLSLRDVELNALLHPKPRPKMSARMQTVYDSIAAAHPQLSSDSIMAIARRQFSHRRVVRDSVHQTENIDFHLDNSMRSWLRLWQASGSIKAGSARMFTPYFPVRNRMEHFDVSFSTDSVNIHGVKINVGHSDFLINGSVSNISRALTSRRGSPIKVDFDIHSDSLNINDITDALMKGAVFTEKIQKGEVKIADSDNDEVINASMASHIDDSERTAFVVPSNITANLHVKANVVQFADILFQRFEGDVSAAGGAVHLNRLGAFTPMGSLAMTALYSAPDKHDVRFATGLVVRRLNLHEFLHMMPEIDSILPMLNSMEGIIDTECALTTELDSMMNFKFHTLDMAMKLSGDSLVLLDSETFRTMSKWLMFKNKKRNMIDSMSVEMMIRDSKLMVYPFMVDMDRYRFGISGSNDAAMNLNYHIAVLKSPIPFKFGVNIKGTPDHLKIRLGGAHFNEREVASSRQLTDTVRINLIREIQNVFRFGVKSGRHVQLTRSEPKSTPAEYVVGDTISHSDSLFFIRSGVLAPPPGWVDPDSVVAEPKKSKKKSKKK